MGELDFDNISYSTQSAPTNVALDYSDPQQEILETTADRVLFHSGIGIGKSQVIGVLSFDFILNNPEVRGFIGANTYNQLAKSTLDRVKNVWEKQFCLIKGVHYVENIQPPKNFKRFGADLSSYENTISFQNGGLIFTASLDNYKVIDGTEFGWACLDETKDTKEEAVKEVIIQRLRQNGMMVGSDGTVYKTAKYNAQTGLVDDILKSNLAEGVWFKDAEGKIINQKGHEIKGYNPLYIFTSPAKAKWLSEWFHLDDDADEIIKHCLSETDYYRKRKGRQLVVIASSYHNKNNLPAGFIEGILDDLVGNQNLIDMLIYGSPFGKTGGEYCTTYNRLKHVLEFEPWPDASIHLTFDFNAVPYMTGLCLQLKLNEETGRYLVRFFDEYCLENPKNDSETLSEEIITFNEPLLENGMFYYGDYSGGNKSTVSKDTRDNYHAIEKKFKKWLSNKSRRVIVNTGLESRRRFCNKAFAGKFPFDIEIHKKCKNLRGDLEFCKEGPDGGILKSTITKNGKTYQEHGHCFVGSTLITTILGQKRIDQIEVGDLVLTRKGYKPVLKVFNNGVKEVKSYFIGDKKLTCTPDHKIYTKNKGFTRVSLLMHNNIFCVFDGKKISEKVFFITNERIVKEESVYDLMVNEEHEYFANGILVHNCLDAALYALTSMFNNYFKGQ